MQLHEASSNDHNVDFYNAINMRTFARSAGLDDCPDLETIEASIQPDRRRAKVLEVGAGYGRVVRRLLEKGYQQVYAIERSTAADEIEKDLAGAVAAGQLTVCRQDVREFDSEERFDVILWMFSGIADFSPEEQLLMLANLAAHLAPGGRLVLDLPPAEETSATRVEGKTQLIEIPGLPTYHGTVPTGVEVLRWANRLSFCNVQRIQYQPIAGQPERDRVLFVLAERIEEALMARAA